MTQRNLFDPEPSASFHNTIDLVGDELEKENINCSKQEDRILKLFEGKMSPFEVMEKYNKIYSAIPITSVRRAITNLTERGKLIKLDKEFKTGEYGKPNHLWIKIEG